MTIFAAYFRNSPDIRTITFKNIALVEDNGASRFYYPTNGLPNSINQS